MFWQHVSPLTGLRAYEPGCFYLECTETYSCKVPLQDPAINYRDAFIHCR